MSKNDPAMKPNSLTITEDQAKAIKAHTRAIAAEDRYLLGRYITPQGRWDMNAKKQAAAAKCKSLGIDLAAR